MTKTTEDVSTLAHVMNTLGQLLCQLLNPLSSHNTISIIIYVAHSRPINTENYSYNIIPIIQQAHKLKKSKLAYHTMIIASRISQKMGNCTSACMTWSHPINGFSFDNFVTTSFQFVYIFTLTHGTSPTNP